MSSLLAEQYVYEIRLRRDRIASFDEFPFSLPAIFHLDTLRLHPKVTFIVGENGSGKSTLLEAAAIAFGLNTSTRMAATRCTNNPTANRSSRS